MPGAAIQTRNVDFVLPLEKIAAALITLAMLKGASRIFRVPSFPSFYLSQ